MTLVEKLLAFKVTPPFDALRDTELALIAAAAREHRFAAGETIHPGPEPFTRFHLLVSGGWTGPDGPLPRTLGLGSLLYGQPAPGAIMAAPDTETVCLVIGKSHFHTIANECPELLLGYLHSTSALSRPAAS